MIYWIAHDFFLNFSGDRFVGISFVFVGISISSGFVNNNRTWNNRGNFSPVQIKLHDFARLICLLPIKTDLKKYV